MKTHEFERNSDGTLRARTSRRGRDLLCHALLNKGTGFTPEERRALGLEGMLPDSVSTLEEQVTRAHGHVERKSDPLEKYIGMIALQDRNEILFYRLLLEYVEELMPVVYTPTVGAACVAFSRIFRSSRGIWITPEQERRVDDLLDNGDSGDVRLIVVTDGERILGLGDQGAGGMGIPIGKLSLYTLGAGIHPSRCLPISLDVGTDNGDLLRNPLYIGWRQPRLRGDDYWEFVDEFVESVEQCFPGVLLQWEDFAKTTSFRHLETHRDSIASFNDDIQGTAAVALGGVWASTRLSGVDFADLKIMFLGAGSAATGIADLIVPALVQTGLSEQQARERLWFVDVEGLVVKGRDDLMEHNLPYAHDHPRTDFLAAIRSIRPQVLIGATGHGGAFTRDVVELMAAINERPTIFALSNPTSHAECTPDQAYQWSEGRAIFASGSPFAPVEYDGRQFRPGQGNNVYIFPGMGLGATACRARRITDEMFLVAAQTLAGLVSEDDLAAGSVYPPLADMRNISLKVATAVAERAYASELAREPRPDDLERAIQGSMYNSTY